MKKLINFISASLLAISFYSHADYVCVSCSGKCGSRTLITSFQKIDVKAGHCHKLSEDFCQHLQNISKNEPILLIDATRDIISRRISSFFHNLSYHVPMHPQELELCYQKNPLATVNYLITQFNNYIVDLEQYYGSESWQFLDYDYLHDQSFDFEKKYQLMQKGNIYFVNLRLDDIGQWEEIIKSLPIPIDLSKFKLYTTNRGIDKGDFHKSLYLDFLRLVRIKREDFNDIVNGNIEHLKHFYTEKEIEAFKEKWKPYLI